MVGAIAFLVTLGTWQLSRLKWKEQLISRIHTRSAGEPVGLEEMVNLWNKTGDVGYLPVQLTGRFDHQNELYYFNTWQGQSGWNVITPFHLGGQLDSQNDSNIDSGRVVLFNRGFVPTNFRDPSKRLGGQIEGVVTITGLARNPVDEKPNSFVPDNTPAKREFFWKSQQQMATLVRKSSPAKVLPFMVDAGSNKFDARYPIGGTTRIQFSNSHLQYAGTWYGLALALLAVGSVFLYNRQKQSA